ncbi:MAG TPA: hypothetical protein VIV58_38585, partial [Kofleriaceae bacterium]
AVEPGAAALARNCCAIGRRCNVADVRAVCGFAIARIARDHPVLVQEVYVTAAIVSRRHRLTVTPSSPALAPTSGDPSTTP